MLPLVAMFQDALIPQFDDPARGGVPAQGVGLFATQLAVLAVSDSVRVLAASRARTKPGPRPSRSLRSRLARACVFAGPAARLVVDGRR